MIDIAKRVVIVDFHLGNLFSVKQACDAVGMNSVVSSSPEDILEADAIILPGVGAFIEAMKNLNQLGLISPIKDAVGRGKPIFGVCLGLQLLFTESEEFGAEKGLDLISGCIKKFPFTLNSTPIKVPQIGWNRINTHHRDWKDTPLEDIEEGGFMYFVHSYYVKPDNIDCVITQTNYCGVDYCSGILKDNIFATQFHPEKSAHNGLSIYKNWAKLYNLI